MSDIEHLTDRDLLLGLDGELSDSRKADVARHLSGCPACRRRHAAIADTGAAVASVYQEEFARASVDRRSRAELRARLDAVAGGTRSSWQLQGGSLATVWRTIASAAVVSTAAIMVWLLLPSGRLESNTYKTVSLPIAWATPGATWDVTAAELCAGTRHTTPISEPMRRQVLNAYGMERVPPDEYELDYLVTPELGGATDARNLWPQAYASPVWNARVKDELERLLPQLVCDGRLDLETAQREMAVDWIAAYKKYFGTDLPLQAHRADQFEDEEDDGVMLVAARRTSAVRLVSIVR